MKSAGNNAYHDNGWWVGFTKIEIKM